ncbi:hypothetical protein L9F63_022022, partial [Diploptera punctata]
NFVREAGTALSRVVQLTEEKLGTSEKTELDAHFENLAERSDTTKLWTEKILRNTEAVLTPNPGNRVEDFLFEKIDKKRPNRLSNLEYLGLDMIEAGNEFGPGTAYGTSLIKKEGVSPEVLLEQAEKELRIAQSEFDRQAEITKLLLESISSSHASHLRSLHEFVETQVRYFAQCHNIMQDLQRDMAGLSLGAPGTTSYQALSLQSPDNADVSKNGQQRARVLYDYDAKDATELSLMADEVITVHEIEDAADGAEDYLMGERGNQKGKVPKAFLEVLTY